MAPQKHPSSQGAGCALAMVRLLAEVAVDKVAEVSGKAWAASIAGTAELLEEGPLGGRAGGGAWGGGASSSSES
jgi:hypothetical protein